MERQKLVLGLTPLRTQILLLPYKDPGLLPPWSLYPCQTVSPGLTPALLNRRQPPTAVTLAQLLGQERADVSVGKEVTHVSLHLGGTAAGSLPNHISPGICSTFSECG